MSTICRMKIHNLFVILSLSLIFIGGCTTSPDVQKQSSNTKEQPASHNKPITLKEEGPRLQQKSVTNTKEPAKKEKPKQKQAPVVRKTSTRPPISKKQKETPVKKQKKKPQTEKKAKPEPKKEVIAEFEGVSITKETYVKTKSEIEIVVDELNHITAKKDYLKWLQYISEDYKKAYSNPVRLKAVSEALPIKGIQLKSLRDYFLYVFVPSRQNIHVDDITFVSPTRVEVIMNRNGSTLLVYNIEKVENGWELIPPK